MRKSGLNICQSREKFFTTPGRPGGGCAELRFENKFRFGKKWRGITDKEEKTILFGGDID